MLKLNLQSVHSICSSDAHMLHTPAAVHAVETTWSAFEYRLETLHYMDRDGNVEHVGWNGTVHHLRIEVLTFWIFTWLISGRTHQFWDRGVTEFLLKKKKRNHSSQAFGTT